MIRARGQWLGAELAWRGVASIAWRFCLGLMQLPYIPLTALFTAHRTFSAANTRTPGADGWMEDVKGETLHVVARFIIRSSIIYLLDI